MDRPSGRVALECSGVAKLAIGSGFRAIVNRREKVVLVGRNGQGKTTLSRPFSP
jgi:ATPase subunit of ABC transporter with duplicated ATPase domains